MVFMDVFVNTGGSDWFKSCQLHHERLMDSKCQQFSKTTSKQTKKNANRKQASLSNTSDITVFKYQARLVEHQILYSCSESHSTSLNYLFIGL